MLAFIRGDGVPRDGVSRDTRYGRSFAVQGLSGLRLLFTIIMRDFERPFLGGQVDSDSGLYLVALYEPFVCLV